MSVGYAGQPAGSCDYCGQGIKYCCHIRSADGREFVVGCDCVMKLDRKTNAKLVEVVETEKKRIEREHRRELAKARRQRESARIAAAFESLGQSPAKQASLAAQPHPRGFAGLTLGDYVEWMRRNAGHGGMLQVAKIIEDQPGEIGDNWQGQHLVIQLANAS